MDKVEFCTHDEVIYALHGKGTIIAIETMTINNESQEFLKIKMASKSKKP